MVQRRHEAVFRFKGDNIGSRQMGLLNGRIETGFHSENKQCTFSGISLHLPLAVDFLQRRVVAQHRRAGKFHQVGVPGVGNIGAFKIKRPLRFVTDAADVE